MKQTLTFFAAILLLAVGATAQKLSYQAVVRNNANELVAGATVQVTVSILNATGDVQYAESHANVQTNLNGLLSLMIGDGTPTGTATMADVVWTGASVKTIITLPAGASVTSVTPVNAVPYALYADNVDPSVVEDAVTDYIAAHGAGGEANVQADWNVTDPTSDAYIQNKPVNVSVFNNNAGYITSADIPAQANADWDATSGVAQILNKPTGVSAFDNDANYITAADIPAIPTVPSDVSAFNNDANYITNTGSCANSVDLCDLLEKLELLENQIQPIMILTGGVTEVTTNSFTVNGKVLTDVTSSVNQRGFVYATGHNPTLSNNSVNNGTGTGEYSFTITGLTAGTTYYVRAFASNDNGTYYGNEVAVTTTAITPSTIPSVTTIAVTNITVSEATVKGAVTSDGGENVMQRGFVYGTQPNPTTMDASVAYHGTGVGQFSNLIASLVSGETYYVRAFATNSVGTAYGNEISFTTSLPSPVAGDAIPCPGTPTVTDHEGNVYNTVKIGTQCWTKENMRAVTSPSTGTYLIPPAGTTFTYTGKQARWYANDSATYAPRNYGLLYNWNAAVDTFNTDYGETSVNPTLSTAAVDVVFTGHRRGICPEGWHVPNKVEWTILTDYLDSHEEYRSGGFSLYLAKAMASTYDWAGYSDISYSPANNPSANNASGFSALPAGYINSSNMFVGYPYTTSFWYDTQLENLHSQAYRIRIGDNSNMAPLADRVGESKFYGYSVRCLRDETSGGGSSENTPVIDEKSCTLTPTVTDVDGNIYSTLQIGNQCWMRENLRTVPTNSDYGIQGNTIKDAIDIGYYYYPNNNDEIVTEYGLLYNWTAATNGNNDFQGAVQGVCPNGWHLPSYTEYSTLRQYLDTATYNNTANGYRCHISYSIAKALAGTSNWETSSVHCAPGNEMSTNNSSKFDAPPAGIVWYANYVNFNNRSTFWTSTEHNNDVSAGYYFGINYDQEDAYLSFDNKGNGRSVRCLRD